MSPFKEVMCDLETWGRRAGCSIMSIGAVRFSEDGIGGANPGEQFHVIVSRESCKTAGLHEDPSTIEWWGKQKPEAQRTMVLTESEHAIDLKTALVQFGEFVNSVKGSKVWGNGADFDNAILYAAYAAVGLEVPWQFWDSRCYRTLKNMRPTVKADKRGGIYHNALDDAIYQAGHAVYLLRSL